MFSIKEATVGIDACQPINLGVFTCNGPLRDHGHAFHELALITGGHGLQSAANVQQKLAAGCVYLIEAGASHAFLKAKDLEVRNLYFSVDWFSPELWPTPLGAGIGQNPYVTRGPSVAHAALEMRRFDAILNEYEQINEELLRPDRSLALLRACTMKILTHLSRSVSHVSCGPVPVRPQLWHALWYLDAMVASGQPLDRNALAQQVKLSPDRLSRLFHEAVGCSLMEAYQERRLRQVCSLLLETSMSITDIAQRLGYSDAPHLSRVFGRHMGITPSQFRRHRGKDAALPRS